MFWRCDCVRPVWLALQGIKEECDAESGRNSHSGVLNESVVLFGHDDNFKSDVTFDLILLIGKLFIYKCKIEKTTPKFPTFKIYLKTRYENRKTYIEHKYDI